jgi:hypothetical protein
MMMGVDGMTKFKIELTNEMNERLEPLFIESSLDLIDYMNHCDFLDKILIKLLGDDSDNDMEYFLNYGKFKITIYNTPIFFNCDELLEEALDEYSEEETEND